MTDVMLQILQTITKEITLTDSFSYIVVLFVTLISVWLYFNNQVANTQKEIINNYLKDENNIYALQKDLESKITYYPSLYKNILNYTLEKITQLIGKHKLLSYRSFNWHFKYSIIYSFIFFYISWMMGSNGNINALNIFPNNDRLLISAFLLIEIIIIFFLFFKFDTLINFFKKYFNIKDKWINLIIYPMLTLILLISGTIGKTINGVDVLGGILSGIILILIIQGIDLKKIIAGGIFIGIVAATEFIKITGFLGGLIMIYLLFFLVLPLINSIFDYLSMYFSRLFAYRILKDSAFYIFLDIILDTLIAIVLFIGLAYTLYYTVTYFNIYLIKEESIFIPVEMSKKELLKNPFNKDVLWITMMFFSTFIPTLVHFSLALGTMVVQIIVKPHIHTIINQLEMIQVQPSITQIDKEYIAKNLAPYKIITHYRLYIFAIVSLILLLCCSIFLMSIKLNLYAL